MKQTLKIIVFVVTLLALDALFAGVWWNLWMNHGWPGPTGLLARMLKADGEHYYDAIFDEMIILGVVVLLAGLGAAKLYRSRLSHRQQARETGRFP
jgi:hypothetical protein